MGRSRADARFGQCGVHLGPGGLRTGRRPDRPGRGPSLRPPLGSGHPGQEGFKNN